MKASDEQILELVERGLNNRQIAIELGIVPSGNFNNRCRELRKNNGVPESSIKRGRPAGSKTSVIETGILRFEDIRKDDRLMKGRKRLVVFKVDNECISVRNMLGQAIFITRKDFEKHATEYTKVPSGDPQGAPVKAYHVDPEPKLSAGDIKVNGQPIKNLPDEVKQKIVDKLKEKTIPDPPIIPSLLEGRKCATVNPEFEAAVQGMVAELKAGKEQARNELIAAIESAPDNVQPLHIDLEMDPSSDPVSPPVFTNEDYTDTEWFDKPIPRKGTVERAIWDNAYNEIKEIQTLRASIQIALSHGDRLPTAYVEKYNKYVSKYSEEVGA